MTERMPHMEPEARSTLRRLLPCMAWCRQVTARSLRADLQAGLTGAVIVLPQGVAFATIAGLPPEYGLYTAIVPVIVAALFGSSHHLVSGPTTAISLVLFANVSQLATPGTPRYVELVLALTLLAGLLQLGLGLFRLGAVINFVSHSVVVGFTAGAAILIATSQLGGFLGVALPSGGSFLATWAALAGRLGDTNPRVLAVAACTLAVAVAAKRLRPRWPNLLLAMVAGSGLNLLLSGHDHGVRLVGALPERLPPFSWPVLDLERLRALAGGAMAVAMLGLAEAVSIAKAVSGRTHQRLDNNQEFVGQGLSNVVGSFFSAYASSGSFTRTGVNLEAGARTPLAAVFSAAGVAGMLLLVAPLMAWLPIPAMAGAILLVAWNLIDFKAIAAIARFSRAEAGVMAATFLASLFLALELAVLLGVLLALLLYLERTSHPGLMVLAPVTLPGGRHFGDARHLGLAECPQLKVLRLDGSLFFGAVNHVGQQLHDLMTAHPEQYHLLLVGTGMNFVDATGAEMLDHLAREMRQTGRQLSFCNLKPDVLRALERGGIGAGPGTVFRDKEDAIAAIVPRLDPERCSTCAARVFLECAAMPGVTARPAGSTPPGRQ